MDGKHFKTNTACSADKNDSVLLRQSKNESIYHDQKIYIYIVSWGLNLNS